MYASLSLSQRVACVLLDRVRGKRHRWRGEKPQTFSQIAMADKVEQRL